jgi:hypothetical protein
MTTDTSTQTDLGPTDEEIIARREAADAEARAEAQAEADATSEHVVAFGCRDADRVFTGSAPGDRKNAYKVKIEDCPGCGESHEIVAMPRPRRPHDEISLTIDPPPPARSPAGDGYSTRMSPKSDAQIIAAIPPEWTPYKNIAEALGYPNPKSFRNRLREMRQRADAKGEPHPFETDSSTAGLKLRAAGGTIS